MAGYRTNLHKSMNFVYKKKKEKKKEKNKRRRKRRGKKTMMIQRRSWTYSYLNSLK